LWLAARSHLRRPTLEPEEAVVRSPAEESAEARKQEEAVQSPEEAAARRAEVEVEVEVE
jgi:hypothetical protein